MASTENLINTIINDKYKIKKLIGVGGMGVVYVAEDIELEREVCIKFLRNQHIGDEHFEQRFKKEASNLAKLNSENIVNIYNIGTYEDTKFFVMEYIDGISLENLIKSKGKIEWKDALDIIYSVLNALRSAHEKHIIHRDIKPSNIIISKNGGVIKLTDFGLAKFIDDKKTITEAGSILGTPYYMSPEQWIGKEVTSYTDMFSIGITLYEMLMGDVPYKSDNYSDLIVSIEKNDIEDKIKELKDIPDEVKVLLLRLLSIIPDYRNNAEFNYNYIKDIIKKYSSKTETSINDHLEHFSNKLENIVSNDISTIPTQITDNKSSEIKIKADTGILMKSIFIGIGCIILLLTIYVLLLIYL